MAFVCRGFVKKRGFLEEKRNAMAEITWIFLFFYMRTNDFFSVTLFLFFFISVQPHHEQWRKCLWCCANSCTSNFGVCESVQVPLYLKFHIEIETNTCELVKILDKIAEDKVANMVTLLVCILQAKHINSIFWWRQ